MIPNPVSSENSGNVVFHYTTLAAFSKISESMTIRLSPFGKTNDPYEWTTFPLDWTDRYLAKDRDFVEARHLEIQELWGSVNQRIKVFGGYSEKHPDLGSLNTPPNGRVNLPLWAHYGDNHNGVCLVIDRAKFSENLAGLNINPFSGFVDYGSICKEEWGAAHKVSSEELAKPNRSAMVSGHLSEYHRELFFRKSREWTEESEWRWVVEYGEGEHLAVPIDGSITEIILGQKVETFFRASALQAAQKIGAKLYQATWDHLSGTIDCYELPPG